MASPNQNEKNWKYNKCVQVTHWLGCPDRPNQGHQDLEEHPESVARQPEAAGDIRGVTIITAAFIEGVCLFSVVVCMLINFGLAAAFEK